ncbi:hypothetical protein FQZ97_1271610 [compost metagenome]
MEFIGTAEGEGQAVTDAGRLVQVDLAALKLLFDQALAGGWLHGFGHALAPSLAKR